jgi:hypothetical protein
LKSSKLGHNTYRLPFWDKSTLCQWLLNSNYLKSHTVEFLIVCWGLAPYLNRGGDPPKYVSYPTTASSFVAHTTFSAIHPSSANIIRVIKSSTYRRLKIINDPHISEKTTHCEHHTLLLSASTQWKLCVCMHVSVHTHTHRHSNAEAPKHRDGRKHELKKLPYNLHVITRWGQVVCFTQIRIQTGWIPQQVSLHWPSIKFWTLPGINLSSLPQLVT